MEEWNDQAIVLRLGLFHENDVWLKVLFRKHGLMTIFAFGGAKSIRRFCGCLDLFNILECRVKSSRNGNYFNLLESTLLSGTQRLRHDWRRMGVAVNCMKFLELAGGDGGEATTFFNILQNLHVCLEKSVYITPLFPLFFRFSLACHAGFAPNLHICSHCGAIINDDARFLIKEGKVICKKCMYGISSLGQNVHVSFNVLETLQKVEVQLPVQWSQLILGQNDRMNCAVLINKFVGYHTGIELGESGFKKLA